MSTDDGVHVTLQIQTEVLPLESSTIFFAVFSFSSIPPVTSNVESSVSIGVDKYPEESTVTSGISMAYYLVTC